REGDLAGDHRCGRSGWRDRGGRLARVQSGAPLLYGAPGAPRERGRGVLLLRLRAPGGEGRLHRDSGPGPAVGGAAAGVPRGSAPGGRKRRRGATARRCARARALRLALALLEPLEAAGASGGTPDLYTFCARIFRDSCGAVLALAASPRSRDVEARARP